MTASNDKIRRELGFGLIDAERGRDDQHNNWRSFLDQHFKRPDPRKQQDEQCNGVSKIEVAPILPPDVTYFKSIEEYELLDSDSKDSKMAQGLADYISSTCKQHIADDEAIPAEMRTNASNIEKLRREIISYCEKIQTEEKPIDVMAVTRSMCK